MDTPLSKTQRKKMMNAAQQLGEALALVPTANLKTLALPETLFDAIATVKKITQHEAKRRQFQYIGRLMRDVDIAPIAAFLAARQNVDDEAKTALLTIERWRERLLTEENALLLLRAQFPDSVAMDQWQTLIARARQGVDTDAGKKAYRALFRELKKVLIDSPSHEEKEGL